MGSEMCIRDRGATLVFCESLRYWYDHEAEEGDDEPPTRPPQAERRGIDVDDANLIDRAYRDREMRNISRAVLRMFYCENRHPRDIERELSLGEKTLNMHRERAVNQIFRIVESLEKEA